MLFAGLSLMMSLDTTNFVLSFVHGVSSVESGIPENFPFYTYFKHVEDKQMGF